MSGNDEGSPVNSQALRDARLKRFRSETESSYSEITETSGAPSPPSTAASSSLYNTPIPAQSRDATQQSRYYNGSRVASGSSGLNMYEASDKQSISQNINARSQASLTRAPPFSDAFQIPGLGNANTSMRWKSDPLTGGSGFNATGVERKPSLLTFTSSTGRKLSVSDNTPERPRKRLNTGGSADPIDMLTDGASSPDIKRPGRPNFLAPSEDSDTDSNASIGKVAREFLGPANAPRIVRRSQEVPSSPPSAEKKDLGEAFKRFAMIHPEHSSEVVRLAWVEANQDPKKASLLLLNNTFKQRHFDKLKPPKSEVGKVEIDHAAREAEREALRQKAKKSAIYMKRPNLQTTTPSSVSASPSVPLALRSPTASTSRVPASPSSPAVAPRVAKRRAVAQTVIDSDSDDSSKKRRIVKNDVVAISSDSEPEEDTYELEALNWLNSSPADALCALTGCTPVQAEKILELRPFRAPQDLRTRLNQGKKKAGPAGVSPNMFDGIVSIFQGYGAVDTILKKCEKFGADIRRSISAWSTRNPSKQDATFNDPGAIHLTDMSEFNNFEGGMLRPSALLARGITLKDYQVLGFNWLSLLHKKSLSCILADEMGLGKTVQVISFLAALKEKGNHGPHLIVVPSSTLENWCREFDRFAPSISIQTYYAKKDERPQLRANLRDSCYDTKTRKGWEVLITTYTLAQSDGFDKKFFRQMGWETCIFDEGHVLKNFQSQRYQSLIRIPTNWRLLLTGTPLQNDLQELVSLMYFILPDHFEGSVADLRAIFKIRGDSAAALLARERVTRAKTMMTPFVLRRRKDMVLKDLPKKYERIEWCELGTSQKVLYKNALQRSRKALLEFQEENKEVVKPVRKAASRSKAKAGSSDNSSNVLMDLRKAAMHPMLFRVLFTDSILQNMTKSLMREPDFKARGANAELVEEDMSVMTDSELQVFCGTYKCLQKYKQDDDCFANSGKVEVLLDLLKQYSAEGRRCLVFSQFTQILDILEIVLKRNSYRYLVLTGSTQVDTRQALVDDFNNDDGISVFLLSTKAGGMGINLTAASVVILFDQDFNPHNDKQAMDRAYRIGQKRDVNVIKLITRGTIEEDMLKLGQTKLRLDTAVAGEEDEEEDKNKQNAMKSSLLSTLRKQLVDGEDNNSAIVIDDTS